MQVVSVDVCITYIDIVCMYVHVCSATKLLIDESIVCVCLCSAL